MNTKKLMPVILSYFIILFTMIAVGMLLIESYTGVHIAAAIFVFIPYTILFVSLCYTKIDKVENIIQNGLFTTISVIYLALSIIVSTFALLTEMTLRITCVLEIIVMCIAMVGLVAAVAAKNHIES